jgi:hypothetical protein
LFTDVHADNDWPYRECVAISQGTGCLSPAFTRIGSANCRADDAALAHGFSYRRLNAWQIFHCEQFARESSHGCRANFSKHEEYSAEAIFPLLRNGGDTGMSLATMPPIILLGHFTYLIGAAFNVACRRVCNRIRRIGYSVGTEFLKPTCRVKRKIVPRITPNIIPGGACRATRP